jgi:hypothetical protein
MQVRVGKRMTDIVRVRIASQEADTITKGSIGLISVRASLDTP